jgi:hypothetical protein
MATNKNSRKKRQTFSTAIIVALITCAGTVLSGLGGKIVEVIVNPDWIVLLQNNPHPVATLTATATTPIFSPTPAIMRTLTASSEPTATLLPECPGAEIYFKLDLSTGVDQTKCPNQQNIIELEYAEIQELSAISGQAVGSAIPSDSQCRWEWYTNETLTKQTIQSLKGDCSFSIGLTKTVTKIYLQLVSAPNRPLFVIDLPR